MPAVSTTWVSIRGLRFKSWVKIGETSYGVYLHPFSRSEPRGCPFVAQGVHLGPKGVHLEPKGVHSGAQKKLRFRLAVGKGREKKQDK